MHANTWPDQGEVRSWQAALQTAADRIRDDRQLDVATSLDAHGPTLWACFAELRIAVAGPHAEVSDSAELFDVLDRWVVFERGTPDLELLDRDRDRIAAHRAALPAAVVRWQACADLVAADVARTTSLSGRWRVEIRQDEDAGSADVRARLREAHGPDGAYASELTIRYGPRVERPRVPLLLPETWLVAAGITEMELPPDVPTAAAGVEEIARRVQDEVIDTISGGWPECPGHGHPAEVSAAAWVCPTDGRAVAVIGRLALG